MDLDKYAKRGENYQYVDDEFVKLKEFLERFQSAEGKGVKIFLQGSYKNHTNIGKESDIDIVVLYESIFHSNIKSREDKHLINYPDQVENHHIERFNNHFSDAKYDYFVFKNALKNHLINNPKYEVSMGNKTIKCNIKNTSFIFDIVCVFNYRFYQNFYDSNSKYVDGNLIKTPLGERVINFPRQTYINSVNKNKDFTDGQYKETIRIIKNIMKNEINEQYWIPSFGLESIVFNVPHKYFLNSNREERIKNVLASARLLVQNNWRKLLEPNKLLFVKDMGKMSQEKALDLLSLMYDKVKKISSYKLYV